MRVKETSPGMCIVNPGPFHFVTGPAEGEPMPDFTLPSHEGRLVNFTAERAGRPALVHFFRSVTWCSFCAMQLDELQQAIAGYEAEGIAVFAICPEPVALLREFAAAHGIRYLLLADEDARYIRQAGVLNTAVDPRDPVYGIPHPGSFLINREGRVFEKRFHADVRVREPMGSLLLYFRVRELNERLEEKVRERTRELERAQMQLVEAARRASLGKLIAGINHELNSPLGALAGSLRAVWSFYGRACEALTPAQREALADLRRTTEEAFGRLEKLAGDLRKFALLDAPEWEAIDLRESMDLVMGLLAHECGQRIRVERDYHEIPRWIGPAAQIHQALLEILSNAVEAIDGEGVIRLSVRQREDALEVAVTDSGRGISAAEQAQLFEPHLRTKGGRVGMSLGLPLANQIIRDQGGWLDVISAPGETTVRITLPLRRADRSGG